MKNLLSNAFKFTPKGRVCLTIDKPAPQVDLSACNLDHGSTIAFSVSDTGEGIAKEKQQVIFEAFEQTDASVSRKYGGTGLGLSLSKEFAALLGGHIHLKSEVGKGSTFTFFIPRTLHPDLIALGQHSPGFKGVMLDQGGNDKAEPVAVAEQPSVSDDRQGISAGDKSILIIEDDPKFAQMLADLSGEKEFKVLIAGDGESALVLADKYSPSAVILDIGLPDLDGWAVMARLKDNPWTRHIPVHFITGAEKDLDAMRMGAIGYLTKPVSLEEMEQVFARIEAVIARPVKRLLVAAPKPSKIQDISDLLAGKDLEITSVDGGQAALDRLAVDTFDGIILNPDLTDMPCMDLLARIRDRIDGHAFPVILYLDRDLTRQEVKAINLYSEFGIVKDVRSPERLLDETNLFLHRVEADLPAEKQRMLKLVHDKEALFKDKKILLADDDMRNLFALSSVLEDKGMEVLAGANGKQALEILQANPDTALVLMDIMMPEMDGYQAMRSIRKMKGFEKVPIIALTAKGSRKNNFTF